MPPHGAGDTKKQPDERTRLAIQKALRATALKAEAQVESQSEAPEDTDQQTHGTSSQNQYGQSSGMGAPPGQYGYPPQTSYGTGTAPQYSQQPLDPYSYPSQSSQGAGTSSQYPQQPTDPYSYPSQSSQGAGTSSQYPQQPPGTYGKPSAPTYPQQGYPSNLSDPGNPSAQQGQFAPGYVQYPTPSAGGSSSGRGGQGQPGKYFWQKVEFPNEKDKAPDDRTKKSHGSSGHKKRDR